mmetsp:Transcript_19040/g.24580  ORF Transcript_19040/g.24580 Transcript_19040/m.24580 type:complete len:864 (-) Transcript_19040:325-2916(-)
MEDDTPNTTTLRSNGSNEDKNDWEQEAMAALMADLANASEEQVVPYVGAAIDRGMGSQLEIYLEDFIRVKDTEIDRACNKHFGDFINSVNALVDMKNDAKVLKMKIKNLNCGLQQSGKEYLALGTELLRQKELKLKIKKTQKLIIEARDLVNLIAAAEAQVEEKRYYSALDTLEKVKEMVAGVCAAPLVQMRETWVPALVEGVKEATLRDVSSWLVEARDQAQKVGETALCRCAWQGGGASSATAMADLSLLEGQPLVIGDEKTTFSLRFMRRLEETVGLDLPDLPPSEITSWVPGFLLASHDRELDSEFLDNLPEKLAIMHRGLHIFHRLGDLLFFRQFYTSGRKAQAELQAMFPGKDLQNMTTAAFLEIFPQLIQRIAGFFLIEDGLLEAVDYKAGIMTRGELEELWSATQENLIHMLERRLSEVSTPTEFLQVKETIFVLSRTMGQDGLHLDTAPLIAFLMKMWQLFGGIQIVHLEIACRQILAEETHQPMTIESEDVYLEMERLGLLLENEVDEEAEILGELESLRVSGGLSPRLEASFPMSVPFSKGVPALARELHRFTIRTLFYAASLTTHRMGKSIMSAIDSALNHTRTVLNEHLQGEVPITQVVQTSINAGYLAQIPPHLEALIRQGVTAILWEQVEEEELSELKLTPDLFAGISSAAHAATFELIQGKLNDLLGGISFVNFEPQKPSREPSPYVEDVTGYLRVTFMCSTHLSSVDREAIHFASCSFINNHLLLHILDEVPKLNIIGISNFSRDLRAFEDFAGECGVAGLQECFAELRQLCDALLNPDFTGIMAAKETRETLYPKVDPNKMITILEKYEGLGMIAKIKQREGKDFPQLEKKAAQQVIRLLQSQGF